MEQVIQVVVLLTALVVWYYVAVVAKNLNRAKEWEEENNPEVIKIKTSLSEAPYTLKMTQSDFESIDMSLDSNRELFRLITLFYKGMDKESKHWRFLVEDDCQRHFNLNDKHATILSNLIPALEIIKNDFIRLQNNRGKLEALDNEMIHEIELMKLVSEKLEYGVTALNPTILEAITQVVLAIVEHEQKLNTTSLSELEEELMMYDALKEQQKDESTLEQTVFEWKRNKRTESRLHGSEKGQ